MLRNTTESQLPPPLTGLRLKNLSHFFMYHNLGKVIGSKQYKYFLLLFCFKVKNGNLNYFTVKLIPVSTPNQAMCVETESAKSQPGLLTLFTAAWFMMKKVLKLFSIQPPVEILCSGEKKKLAHVKEQIVSLDLPKHCEASNEHFKIEQVLTAKLKPMSLGVKSFSIASFKMNDINRDHLKIRNAATHDVIKNLLNESKLSKEMEKTLRHKKIVSIFGYSTGSLFALGFGVCCVYFIVKLLKK